MQLFALIALFTFFKASVNLSVQAHRSIEMSRLIWLKIYDKIASRNY